MVPCSYCQELVTVLLPQAKECKVTSTLTLDGLHISGSALLFSRCYLGIGRTSRVQVPICYFEAHGT